MSELGIVVAVARSAEMAWASDGSLSPAERTRMEALTSVARRRDYACGRILLRRLLEHVSGRPAAEHIISMEATGKPLCDAGFGVSIAHSGGLIASAVTGTGGVGIDIEVPDAARDVDRLADRFFSSWEIDWLRTAPDNSFFRLWVLKEAWLKLIGTGLSGGLDRLQCRLRNDGIQARFDVGDEGGLFLYDWDGVPVGLAVGAPAETSPVLLEWRGNDRVLAEPEPRAAVLALKRC